MRCVCGWVGVPCIHQTQPRRKMLTLRIVSPTGNSWHQRVIHEFSITFLSSSGQCFPTANSLTSPCDASESLVKMAGFYVKTTFRHCVDMAGEDFILLLLFLSSFESMAWHGVMWGWLQFWLFLLFFPGSLTARSFWHIFDRLMASLLFRNWKLNI